MNIQVLDVSATRKTLTVNLDATEVAAEYKTVLGQVSKQVKIPGFRPGKVPSAILLKQFGKSVQEEFKQRIVGRACQEGIRDAKLDVIQIVNIQEGDIAPDKFAGIVITVDIRPSFDLPEIVGLPVTVAPVEPTDEQVEAKIQALREEHLEFKVADRPAQKSDHVKLSYEGQLDGQAVSDLVPDKQIFGKVPQTWEEVEGESEGLLPGLGKQLAGLKTGDKQVISVTFPAEFVAAPALAGKTASYAVEVLEVRERVLPELNEAFFKSQNVEDLAGLQNKMRSDLRASKEQENSLGKRRQVLEVLASKLNFPVPESLIEQETQGLLRQFLQENQRRGVPIEAIEKDKGSIAAAARNTAEMRVKTQLILARVAEQEKLQVEASDIDAYLYGQSMQTGIKPEKLVNELTKDRERLRAVQQRIVFDKAVDLLVDKAIVTEATVTA